MDDIEELENKLKTSKDNIHLYNKKNKPDKIENVSIDTNLPLVERIYDFFKKVNNPYILKVGNIIAKCCKLPTSDIENILTNSISMCYHHIILLYTDINPT